MHGWFCSIRLIHLNRWKSLHFEKTRLYESFQKKKGQNSNVALKLAEILRYKTKFNRFFSTNVGMYACQVI